MKLIFPSNEIYISCVLYVLLLEMDECVTDVPCVNGDCVDLRHGYQCNCEPGWTGQNCDGNADKLIEM